MRFLEIVYYDAFYNGIFIIYSHEEMLEWFMNPRDGRACRLSFQKDYPATSAQDAR